MEAGTRAGLLPRKARVSRDPARRLPGAAASGPGAHCWGKGRGLRAPRTGRGGGRGEGGGAGRPGPAAGRRNSPLLPACGARVARIPRSSDAEIRTRSNPSAIFAAAAYSCCDSATAARSQETTTDGRRALTHSHPFPRPLLSPSPKRRWPHWEQKHPARPTRAMPEPALGPRGDGVCACACAEV